MSAPKYSMENHKFDGRICGKPYCIKCGLVQLNNDFTRWAVSKGCDNELHPQYEQSRKKYVKTLD